MSYFKRFGDFCSGFACFASLIWLFSEYMTFDLNNLTLKEKLIGFFDKYKETDNRLMLVLALMLVLSILASVVFKRFPYLTLLFSVPPLMLTVDMIESNYIENYPMMYVILCSLSIVSGVWECICRDRRDGGHRAAFSGDVVSVLASGVMFFIWRKEITLRAITTENFIMLDIFDVEIKNNAEYMDMKLWIIFACVYLALTLVSLILTDVYFIDAILAVAPCAAVIYMWSAGTWTVHPELVVTIAVVNLAVRLIPAISGGKMAAYNKEFRVEGK